MIVAQFRHDPRQVRLRDSFFLPRTLQGPRFRFRRPLDPGCHTSVAPVPVSCRAECRHFEATPVPAVPRRASRPRCKKECHIRFAVPACRGSLRSLPRNVPRAARQRQHRRNESKRLFPKGQRASRVPSNAAGFAVKCLMKSSSGAKDSADVPGQQPDPAPAHVGRNPPIQPV